MIIEYKVKIVNQFIIISLLCIEIVIWNDKEKIEFPLLSGSGVIISQTDIATNCHVAMAGASDEAVDEYEMAPLVGNSDNNNTDNDSPTTQALKKA